jgi:trimeric autotransporter adhesin
VHCENAPSAEAGWDLAARDLQAAPFNYDKQTAFMIAYKLIIQGTGNVTSWHSCNCTAGTSDGCAATAAYLQWLTADDDNGNLNNGTPHMTAVYSAFNRHLIACSTPVQQNSGCATGPTTAPVLSATPTSNGAILSWTAVPNAANYLVMKGKGPWGCNMEKVRIATVTGTTYTDQTLDCHEAAYQVVAVGSNANCIGLMSSCVIVVPPTAPPANVTATASAPNQVTVNWSAVTGATGYNVFRQYTHCGTLYEEQLASNIPSTNYIDTATKVGVTNYYAVSALSTCETAKSP